MVTALAAALVLWLLSVPQDALGDSLAAASTPNPAIAVESNITTAGTAGDGNGANGWGQQKMYVARSSTGGLFAVYDSGANNNDKTYRLVHCTANCGASNATWTTIDSGDGGREVPLLLVGPTNVIYLITWPVTDSSSLACDGVPRVVNEGVNGAGPKTTTLIPSASCSADTGFWNKHDPSHPYAGAAIDRSGNIFVQQNTASSAGGSTADSGYLGRLAWESGCPSGCTWHSTTLPGISGADYRYDYSFLLPDNRGGIDVVAQRDVSCENRSFTSQFGYTTQIAGSQVWMNDAVEDWHTSNLNATGGPAWSQTQISANTKARPDGPVTANCPAIGTGGVVFNDQLTDAYRDTYGVMHVLYKLPGIGTPDHHVLLNADGSVRKDLTMFREFCPSSARIAQDYSSRFYVYTWCPDRKFYVFAGDTIDGTSITGSIKPTVLSIAHSPSNWDYPARPQGGTAMNQNYLDFVYPYSNGTGLGYVRLHLAPGGNPSPTSPFSSAVSPTISRLQLRVVRGKLRLALNLSAPARLTIAVWKLTQGRMVRGRCRTGFRHRHRCLVASARKLKRQRSEGPGRDRFRLRMRRLGPGEYLVIVRATNVFGRSIPRVEIVVVNRSGKSTLVVALRRNPLL